MQDRYTALWCIMESFLYTTLTILAALFVHLVLYNICAFVASLLFCFIVKNLNKDKKQLWNQQILSVFLKLALV